MSIDTQCEPTTRSDPSRAFELATQLADRGENAYWELDFRVAQIASGLRRGIEHAKVYADPVADTLDQAREASRQALTVGERLDAVRRELLELSRSTDPIVATRAQTLVLVFGLDE